MAQTKKALREAYNKKAYKQYNIRVRRDSDLYKFLEEWKEAGNNINELAVSRLNEHYRDLVKRGIWYSDN